MFSNKRQIELSLLFADYFSGLARLQIAEMSIEEIREEILWDLLDDFQDIESERIIDLFVQYVNLIKELK